MYREIWMRKNEGEKQMQRASKRVACSATSWVRGGVIRGSTISRNDSNIRDHAHTTRAEKGSPGAPKFKLKLSYLKLNL